MSNIKTTYSLNGKTISESEYRKIVAKSRLYEDMTGEKLTQCSIDLKVTKTSLTQLPETIKDFGYYICTGESWDSKRSAEWNRNRRWNK